MKKVLLGFISCFVAVTIFAATSAETAAKSTAEKYVNAYNDGSLAQIFALFPKSYQKDVNTVIAGFGNKMDNEIWVAAMGIVKDLAVIGDSKSDILAKMILENKEEGDAKPSAAELSSAVKKAASGLKGVTEVVTLNKLKEGDLGSILADKNVSNLGALSKLNTDKKFDKITEAEEIDDKTVRITYANGDSDNFVLVDKVWVPENIATGFSERMDSAKKSVNEMKISDDDKANILKLLPMLKMGMDGMKKAKNADELEQSAGMLMVMALGAGNIFFTNCAKHVF